jgi:hypothetical protein
MTGFFRKVCNKIDDHLNCVRYLWPDKNVSVRFKFLNLLSADRLRVKVNNVSAEVRRAVYLIRMYAGVYERSVASKDPLNPEQMDKVLQLICKDLDYLERKTDDLYKI